MNFGTAIADISKLGLAPTVAEAEINPLLIGPAGAGVVFLDALIRLEAPPTGDA